MPVDGLQNFPPRSPLASKRGRTWNDAGGWLANLNAPGSNTHEATAINADQAFKRLKEGNRRYVAGALTHPNQTAGRRAEVAKGQKPFAIVFGCVDSRVPPEIVFDRGLGDLLVIRTAGHALDSASVNSVEFGVHELEIPLVMVLGHQRCGAVAATIEAVERRAKPHGALAALIKAIKPAVQKVRGQPGDLLDNAVRANIELTVKRLKALKILTEFIEKGKIRIVGARYDLNTGVVGITLL